MKRTLLAAIVTTVTLSAALPPQYQNEKDLNMMIHYITQYPKVMMTLRSIDLQNYSVYFDDDCKIEFARKVVKRPEGWVGPAEDLELKSSNCSLD